MTAFRITSGSLMGVLLSVIVAFQTAPKKYPDWPATPSVPVPAPMPARDDPVSVLKEGQLYVVQSDAPAQLLASPAGVVEVLEKAGPVTIFGVFADGTGTPELREYTAKHVFLVRRVAQGRVELLRVPKGDVARRTLAGDDNPVPPPKPVDPKPDPKPPLPASPWGNAPGLRVMISFQDRDLADKNKITPQQLSILTGARVREYLDAKCTKVGRDPQYFMWDHEEDVSAMPSVWQDAHKLGAGKTAWVVVGNGEKWEQFTLPATVDAFLAKMKPYE